MAKSTETVVSILADGFGLSEPSVYEAMEREPTISERIERISEGNGSDVDINRLHVDVKATLIGEGASI